MMKIAVTGMSGGLGQHLKTIAPRYDLEIVADRAPCEVALFAGWPSDVDWCEEYPAGVWATVDHFEQLLQGCKSMEPRPRIVFISSDMVAGDSVYGKSKRMAETLVHTYFPGDHLIVRAQSLYGHGGKSWASNLRQQFLDGKDIYAIEDQVVQPTTYTEFANALCKAIVNKDGGTLSLAAGYYCTWYEFALEMEKWWGNPSGRVTPIKAASLNRKAPRLARSVFPDSGLPTWQAQLNAYMLEEQKRDIEKTS